MTSPNPRDEAVAPDVLAKQVADAASDMCEIARIVGEWWHGPKQSLTALREIRECLAAKVDAVRADVIGLRARAEGRRKLGLFDVESEGDAEELATLTVPLRMLERALDAMEAKAPRVVVNPWDGCFDAAMQAVLCGGRANRKDWNRPSHIELRSVEGFSNAVVVMVMRDGSVGPYTPSGCDMVAHDWEMSNG